ncbi:transcriptional regulator [Sulfolobus tengchongensis]|uniref:Transcriptional regulator n=1 Tax=Sulfolobus tengchongensis TaxID=207809 RepID=A0AAX4L4F1_9CREN
MVNLRLNVNNVSDLKCENCGVKLNEDNVYIRIINGKEHYFCCSHCADNYEARIK